MFLPTRILLLLEDRKLTTDEIAKALDAPRSAVLAALRSFERAGRIRSHFRFFPDRGLVSVWVNE